MKFRELNLRINADVPFHSQDMRPLRKGSVVVGDTETLCFTDDCKDLRLFRVFILGSELEQISILVQLVRFNAFVLKPSQDCRFGFREMAFYSPEALGFQTAF